MQTSDSLHDKIEYVVQRILLGSDHAGLKLRNTLNEWAKKEGYSTLEFGAMSSDAYDYPLAADLIISEILKGDVGVLICGSGIGMSIRANRYPGIRAALCFTPEMAELSRQHNHANILCLGERLLDPSKALEILKKFLGTPINMDIRHTHRVNLLDSPHSNYETFI